MWSHSINDGSIGGGESDTPQDSFCRSCDKASSDDDVRQVFNLSAVYQLPFGAGKPISAAPAWRGRYWAAGRSAPSEPRKPGCPSTSPLLVPTLPCRATMRSAEKNGRISCHGVSLTPPGGSTPQEWVNPAAFSTPAAGTFGNLGRNDFRAPAISDVDLALAKDVSFTERMKLRFRADCSTSSIALSMALPTPTSPYPTSEKSPVPSAVTRRAGHAARIPALG